LKDNYCNFPPITPISLTGIVMAQLPTLHDDIHHLIIQSAGENTKEYRRDQSCVETLLSCCLVSKKWRSLAQPILNRVVIANTEDDLERRLFNRSPQDLAGLRELVIRQKWSSHFGVDIEQVLRKIRPQSLRSLFFFEGASQQRSDELDRSLIGQARFSPPPLPFDLSGLREALLCNEGTGSSWVPLLLVTPNLQDLTFYHCGWSGNSCYAHSPTYLPAGPPPFHLKRLEIYRSHIQEAPLRWLLSGGSAETLTHLSLKNLQPEWDTIINISKLRAEGRLPKITHLTLYLMDTGGGSAKYYKQNVSTPLHLWQNLTSMYIYGSDNKSRAAIIHGVSQMSPPPIVEMGVGDMRMVEFKSIFRLRNGKLPPGTTLRLITKRFGEGRMDGYTRWDQHAHEYWTDMEDEAAELAHKHGIKLEVAEGSFYA
jgi:hypothetical protein